MSQFLLTAVVGAFIGGIITICLQQTVALIRRPRIRIIYEEGPDFQTITEVLNAAGKTAYKSRYLRVLIKNEGLSIAKDCNIFIHRIQRKYENFTAESEDTQESIEIDWSFSTPENRLRPKDIPRGIHQYANIFHIRSVGDARLIPCCENFPRRLMNLISLPGTYEIDLIVTGQNFLPARKTIRFAWSGEWPGIEFHA